jgi:hypothetical protein
MITDEIYIDKMILILIRFVNHFFIMLYDSKIDWKPLFKRETFLGISLVCFYGLRERKEENLRHSIYIQIQIVVSQLGFNSNSSKQVSDVKQVFRSQSYQTFFSSQISVLCY